MSTERPYHFDHLLQFSKKISSASDFMHIFHDFIHVYSPGARADNPLGKNCDVNRKASSLWSFVTSLKKSLQPLTLYTFVHEFIHVYSPGARADNPLGTKL